MSISPGYLPFTAPGGPAAVQLPVAKILTLLGQPSYLGVLSVISFSHKPPSPSPFPFAPLVMSSSSLGLSNFLAQYGPDNFLVPGALLVNLYSNCLAAIRAAPSDLTRSVGVPTADLRAWVSRIDDAVSNWQCALHGPESLLLFAPYFAFDLVGSDHVALDVWRSYSSLSAPLLLVFPRRNSTPPPVASNLPVIRPADPLVPSFHSPDPIKRSRVAGSEVDAPALPPSRGRGGKRGRSSSKRRSRQVVQIARSFAKALDPGRRRDDPNYRCDYCSEQEKPCEPPLPRPSGKLPPGCLRCVTERQRCVPGPPLPPNPSLRVSPTLPARLDFLASVSTHVSPAGGSASSPPFSSSGAATGVAGSSSSSFAHVAPLTTASGSSNPPSRLFSSVPSAETREWLSVHGLTVSGLLELMNRPDPDDSPSR